MAGRKAGRKAGRGPGRESGRGPGRESDRGPGRESGRGPAGESGRESDRGTSPAIAFFRDSFGLDETSLSAALGTALERQVDDADLFFEYSTQDSVSLEEGIVKTGSRHIEQGVGVRARRGARQGYAHSDEISPESTRLAAATARAISEQRMDSPSVPVRTGASPADLYPVETPPTEVPVQHKVDLLGDMDRYARGLDPRVQECFLPNGGVILSTPAYPHGTICYRVVAREPLH